MYAADNDASSPTTPSLAALVRTAQHLARPQAQAGLADALARGVVPLVADAAAVDVLVAGRWRRTVARAIPNANGLRLREGASPLSRHPAGLATLLAGAHPLDGAELTRPLPRVAGAGGRPNAHTQALLALVQQLARPLVSGEQRAASPGLLVVALHHGGAPLGLLTLWRRGPDASWPAACRNAVVLLSTQAASTLACATLAERAAGGVTDALESTRRANFFEHATRALAGANCLDGVLNVFTRLGVGQLAHGCAVELCGDPDAQRTVVAHVDAARRLQLGNFLRQMRPGRRRRRAGAAVPEVCVDAAPNLAGTLRLPMLVRGVVRGYVTFLREPPLQDFAPADVELARFLVARCGEAVDRVWRQSELEQVSRVRDEFLRVASHELRTPLAALQLQLGGLRRLCLREPDSALGRTAVQERAERALQQTARLVHLTDSLLDAARTFGGPDRLALRCRRASLSRICRRVLARMLPEAARRGCALGLQVHEEVRGSYDVPQLARALHHLVANAIKYGAQHPVELHLSRRGPWAVLQVRDHGIGVSSAARPRIFGRFERAVSGRAFGGLGLGLYLARRVVAAHGGTIRVRKNTGGGAAFVMLLPLEVGAPPA